MRLLICTKQDLISCIAVNELIQHLGSDMEYHIVLSHKVSDSERGLPPQYDFVFYERDLFLFWSRSSQHNPNGYVGFRDLDTKYGDKHSITLDVLNNISLDTRYLHKLARWKPDVILSVRYNYVFKQPLIDMAELAVLNLHPGKLPEYAGFYAPFHALKNGEQKLGATLHYIRDESLDSGDIIETVNIPVSKHHSVMWHFHEVYRHGILMSVKHLKSLKEGDKPDAYPQDLSKLFLESHPTQQEFKTFESNGGVMISHKDYLDACQQFK